MFDSTGSGKLAGRVAIVTGASRGIGANLAIRFAQEGAAVAVVARTARQGDSKLEGSIDETVAAIKQSGGRAIGIVADLSKRDEIVPIVDQVEAELGPADILVNNAGINRLGYRIEDVLDKHVRLFFEIMVHVPLTLSQRVLPGMKARGEGWIVNISSKMARHPKGPPYPDWARDGSLAHAMCKAALDRLSTGLAAETHGTGIRVNSLGPSGAVITPGVKALNFYTTTHSALEQPAEWMDEAAVILCTGGPELTGGVWTDVELLGLPDENWIWTKSETF